MKILVTGKNGFVGKNLSNQLGYEITSIGREDFNLTDREATNNWFKDKYFDVVIHTAIIGGSRLKKDNSEVFYQNLSMFYNLLANQDKFNQLISFGSGAELGYPTDPYGLSKNIINKIIQIESKLNNIRIYGVFGKDEWDTRFIKSNIKRYINKEPLIIHQNKYMDFFHMEDLITLIKHYINNDNLPKVINCCYNHCVSLYDVAQIINNLDTHKVNINIKHWDMAPPFNGKFVDLGLNFVGLEQGIKNVYNKLKNEY